MSGKSRARNVSDEELWDAGKMRVRIGGDTGEADETDLCGRLGRGMGAVGSHTRLLSLLVVEGRRKPAKAPGESWPCTRPPCFLSPDRVFHLSE